MQAGHCMELCMAACSHKPSLTAVEVVARADDECRGHAGSNCRHHLGDFALLADAPPAPVPNLRGWSTQRQKPLCIKAACCIWPGLAQLFACDELASRTAPPLQLPTTKKLTVPGVLAGMASLGHAQWPSDDHPAAARTDSSTMSVTTAAPAAPAMMTAEHTWGKGWIGGWVAEQQQVF